MKLMSLPTYQIIQLKNSSTEEIEKYLTPDMNLRNPVVFDLKQMRPEDQLEAVGIIQNFFYSQNIPHQFPYGVYLLSHLDKTVARLMIVSQSEELPSFFNTRKSKINMKESHLADKNKILQQDIMNSGLQKVEEDLQLFNQQHRDIFNLEKERKFYHQILKEIL